MKYQPFALGAILREWLCQNDIEPEFPSARRNDGSATAQSGLRTSAAQTPSLHCNGDKFRNDRFSMHKLSIRSSSGFASIFQARMWSCVFHLGNIRRIN